MLNYREQNGCHNCDHCFIYEEYDEGYDYFCTLGAPKRPFCGSVLLKECWDLVRTDQYNKQSDKWTKWAEKRNVQAWSTCNAYEVKKK